jgi:hypothetical protein
MMPWDIVDRIERLEKIIHFAFHAPLELPDDKQNGIVRCDCTEEVRQKRSAEEDPRVFRFDATCLPDGVQIKISNETMGHKSTFVLGKNGWREIVPCETRGRERTE